MLTYIYVEICIFVVKETWKSLLSWLEEAEDGMF